MNEQTRALRTQSSAVVSAAFITTMGAIAAACIQSGWIVRPLDAPLATSDQPQTTFLEPGRRFEIPVLPPAGTTRVTAERPIFEPHSTVLQADPATRRPAGDASWAPVNALAEETRPAKKSSSKFWDWSAMTRFFHF
jgi:hypothetical protein